ncbi:MAG: hypothetical protein MPJ24_04660 [Pirellulaceae bacterium]|nr:hypothetical protein [Pirellulaceae bacterium]
MAHQSLDFLLPKRLGIRPHHLPMLGLFLALHLAMFPLYILIKGAEVQEAVSLNVVPFFFMVLIPLQLGVLYLFGCWIFLGTSHTMSIKLFLWSLYFFILLELPTLGILGDDFESLEGDEFYWMTMIFSPFYTSWFYFPLLMIARLQRYRWVYYPMYHLQNYDLRRFQYRIIDILLITSGVALLLYVGKEGPSISNTNIKPSALVVVITIAGSLSYPYWRFFTFLILSGSKSDNVKPKLLTIWAILLACFSVGVILYFPYAIPSWGILLVLMAILRFCEIRQVRLPKARKEIDDLEVEQPKAQTAEAEEKEKHSLDQANEDL